MNMMMASLLVLIHDRITFSALSHLLHHHDAMEHSQTKIRGRVHCTWCLDWFQSVEYQKLRLEHTEGNWFDMVHPLGADS